MKNTYNSINDNNLSTACNYLQKKFDAKSWWPKAQPGLARQAFTLMKGSAGSLNIWCQQWLDLGQLIKLEKALKSSLINSKK